MERLNWFIATACQVFGFILFTLIFLGWMGFYFAPEVSAFHFARNNLPMLTMGVLIYLVGHLLKGQVKTKRTRDE